MSASDGVHALAVDPGGEHAGSRRRARTQVALDVLEAWIDELRNAPQATMRESVERQVRCAPHDVKLRVAERAAQKEVVSPASSTHCVLYMLLSTANK